MHHAVHTLLVPSPQFLPLERFSPRTECRTVWGLVQRRNQRRAKYFDCCPGDSCNAKDGSPLKPRSSIEIRKLKSVTNISRLFRNDSTASNKRACVGVVHPDRFSRFIVLSAQVQRTRVNVRFFGAAPSGLFRQWRCSINSIGHSELFSVNLSSPKRH